MSISMDEAVNQMKLATLEDLSTDELQRHRCKQPFDDRYSVEILRRALVEQTDQAWLLLQQCLSQTICRWIHTHPYKDVVLLRDSEENYIAQTFSRFWYAVHDQRIAFATLPAALCYLHATLNGIIMDTFRSQLRLRSREVPLPDTDCAIEPAAAHAVSISDQQPWTGLCSLLPDERERRLAYLLYYCGLKPRVLVLRCPKEFDDVKDIYRLNHNIVERLRRNRDRLRHVLDDDE